MACRDRLFFKGHSNKSKRAYRDEGKVAVNKIWLESSRFVLGNIQDRNPVPVELFAFVKNVA